MNFSVTSGWGGDWGMGGTRVKMGGIGGPECRIG